MHFFFFGILILHIEDYYNILIFVYFLCFIKYIGSIDFLVYLRKYESQIILTLV